MPTTTLDILLIDPDVRFAVGVKRGLEQTGEYRVTAFANAQAALDYLPGNPQAIAVVDDALTDVRLIDLIAALQIIQPNLPIVLSRRSGDLPTALPATAFQGYVHKPYIVRALIPQLTIALRSPVNLDQPLTGAAMPAAPKPIKRLSHPVDPTAAAVPPAATALPLPPPEAVPVASVMAAIASESSRILRPIDPLAFSAAELTLRMSRLKIAPPIQAVILTRAGNVMAATGTLTDRALSGLIDAIAQVWQVGSVREAETAPRLRYVQVQDSGESLVYSISRGSDWRLTFVFPAETPIREVRQESRQLLERLDSTPPRYPEPILTPAPLLSPEPEADGGEAARTLLSRPTMARPPKELLDRRSAQPATADTPAAVPIAPGTPYELPPSLGVPTPEVPDVPYSPYTLLWQPNGALLTPEIVTQLPGWVATIAAMQQWRVHETTISPGCVSVRIDLPADQLPGTALDILQEATAQRAQQDDLWSEGYYVIASDRAPLPQEIALFTA